MKARPPFFEAGRIYTTKRKGIALVQSIDLQSSFPIHYHWIVKPRAMNDWMGYGRIDGQLSTDGDIRLTQPLKEIPKNWPYFEYAKRLRSSNNNVLPWGD